MKIEVMSKKPDLRGVRLFNAAKLPLPEYIGGRRLLNANGDIDITSAGYQYLITTLSYIQDKVVEQKFYEVAPGDYMSVDVGKGAWSSETIQNLVFNTGGSFFHGDVDTMEGTAKLAAVDAKLGKINMPNMPWAKAANWTLFEVAQAAVGSNWDIVESKMKSLKKNWDLGIQEVAFLGHPELSAMTGLLNDSEVNINTTLIAEPLSGMTETEFTDFVAGLLPAYWLNSNATQMPDTFIIPTDDYLGLGVPYSSTYPNISKLEYMLNMLKKMTANESFKILPLAYAQDDYNSGRGINKNRYVLYKDDADDLYMSIPIDFTALEVAPLNGINFQAPAYGQYSGVLISRKRGVLYFDETPTT